MNIEELKIQLKRHFGFTDFKGLQREVITNILKKNDSFVIMPTGGGKSLCYQLPALIQEGQKYLTNGSSWILKKSESIQSKTLRFISI